MDDRLKTDYVKLDVLETLRASPAVLLGVDGPASTALEAVAIASVFDLATSRLYSMMMEPATRSSPVWWCPRAACSRCRPRRAAMPASSRSAPMASPWRRRCR
jgi:hypothetical protein